MCATRERAASLMLREAVESRVRPPRDNSAEQDALARFRPRLLERGGHALAPEVEGLRRRIDVMELEHADAVAVAARRTSPAGVVDQDLLDPPAAVADGLDHALGAAIVRLSADPAKPRPAVARAVPHDFVGRAAVAPREPGGVRAQAVMAQPMPDRRRAALERAGDLADRHPDRDERLEVLAREGPAQRVPLRMPGAQAVLVDPVRHGRRIAAHLPGDRLDRRTAFHPLRQPCSVHGANTSSGGRRKVVRCRRVAGATRRPALGLSHSLRGLLDLVLQLAVAPALVGAATLAARRWGQRTGGLVSAFPAIVGPVLLVAALDHGAAFAARAANGTLLGLVALAGFALTYGRVAARNGWRSTLLAAWVAAGVVGLAAGAIAAGPPGGLLAAAASLLAAPRPLRGAGPPPLPGGPPLPRRGPPLRLAPPPPPP